jgi:Tfp pilus assembly protein PilF
MTKWNISETLMGNESDNTSQQVGCSAVKCLKKLYVPLIYLAIAAATIIAFEQVRNNEFVSYDDSDYVTENEHVVKGITPESIRWAFTTTHVGNWHPLTWLSHMLDCELFGLNPKWHHLTNLVLHIANSLLLLWILRRMTGSASSPQTGSVWASAFAAGLFALHPLHVESVAWVAERKDVLSGLFWMLTMAAYVWYAERPSVSRYAAVFLSFGLGLMAKPMLVTLPFVLLLLDFWPLGRFAFSQSVSGKAACQTSASRLIAEKIPLFALVAASCVITYIVQKKEGAVTPVETLPLNYRMANAFISYIAYVIKTVFPWHLAVLYPYRLRTLSGWQPTAALLLLVCVSAAFAYLGRKRRGYLLAGWLWYVGTLVPVIGLVQVGVQAFADRYMYLPSIGLFIIAAYGAADFFSKRTYHKIVPAVLGASILFGLGVCTHAQVKYWKDSISLYRRALAVTKDNYKMHTIIASELQNGGKFAEAEEHYREALRILPDDTETYFLLGNLLRQQGKLDEAAEAYRQALHYEPDNADAHNNLGYILRTQGKLIEALNQFKLALQTKPEWPLPMTGIAQILAVHYDPNVRDANEAVALAEWAAELTKYENATIVDTLATAYAAAGNFERAVETSQKSLELAMKEKNDELAGQISKRLELFKQKKPYRLSAPPQNSAVH